MLPHRGQSRCGRGWHLIVVRGGGGVRIAGIVLPLAIVLPLGDVYDTDYNDGENGNSDHRVPNEIRDTPDNPQNRPKLPSSRCWMLRCTTPSYP
jgi:hypothetical protein